jgi:hypothetical protein
MSKQSEPGILIEDCADARRILAGYRAAVRGLGGLSEAEIGRPFDEVQAHGLGRMAGDLECRLKVVAAKHFLAGHQAAIEATGAEIREPLTPRNCDHPMASVVMDPTRMRWTCKVCGHVFDKDPYPEQKEHSDAEEAPREAQAGGEEEGPDREP